MIIRGGQQGGQHARKGENTNCKGPDFPTQDNTISHTPLRDLNRDTNSEHLVPLRKSGVPGFEEYLHHIMDLSVTVSHDHTSFWFSVAAAMHSGPTAICY